MSLKNQHTAEISNVAAVSDRKAYAFDNSLLDFRETGSFFGLLDQLGIALAVTREYEHFAVLLGGGAGKPLQSPMPLPHPSGMAYDADRDELIISSTRTPNLIFWLKRLKPADYDREIIPDGLLAYDGDVFMPYRSTLLPGTLYIHEIALMGGALYANITGHNFIARLDRDGGWERVWWPSKLDGIEKPFQQNCFQLNSIAAGSSVNDSYYSAFSDLVDGAKPWKQGYGPKGKGVIFSGQTRDVICRDLTCPHSARLIGDAMWVCNSGYGQVGVVDDYRSHDAGRARFRGVAGLPGFTRGLGAVGDYMFVGLSRVIDSYEAYAPGVPPAGSECAVYAVNHRTGEVVAGLTWIKGYQVFDIQILPGMSRPRLPFGITTAEGVNPELRFLG